jgi:hypothetical protein
MHNAVDSPTTITCMHCKSLISYSTAFTAHTQAIRTSQSSRVIRFRMKRLETKRRITTKRDKDPSATEVPRTTSIRGLKFGGMSAGERERETLTIVSRGTAEVQHRG